MGLLGWTALGAFPTVLSTLEKPSPIGNKSRKWGTKHIHLWYDATNYLDWGEGGLMMGLYAHSKCILWGFFVQTIWKMVLYQACVYVYVRRRCLIGGDCSFLTSALLYLSHRMRAEPSGTFWYHSHHGSQFAMGLHGAIVVIDRGDSLNRLITNRVSYITGTE